MHDAAHDSHRKIDGVAAQQNQQPEQHPHSFEREGAGGQVVESLGELDRRQSQRKKSEVAQHIAKGFGQVGKSLQPIQQAGQTAASALDPMAVYW